MGTPTRTRRFDSKRHEVLCAAGRVFARLGFRAATLGDIGAELGTTAAALYYYASSKDELFGSCRQIALDAIDTALDDGRRDGANAYARLQIFFQRYAEVICSDFGRCLALANPGDIPADLLSASRVHQRQIRHAVQALIREGIADGSVRPSDDFVVANCLFGAFNHLPRWWSPQGPRPLSAIADAFVATLAAPLSAADELTQRHTHKLHL